MTVRQHRVRPNGRAWRGACVRLLLLELEARTLLSYSIADLGALSCAGQNSCDSNALAINNAGYIAGNAQTTVNGTKYEHAVLWAPNGASITDLHTLISGDAANSAAQALNNNSPPDVAGSTDVMVDSLVRSHAMRKRSGQAMEDLGTLTGAGSSTGQAINDAQKVAGINIYTGTPDEDPPPRQAFYWDGTQMNALPYHGSGATMSEAWAMDNSSNPLVYGNSQKYTYSGCEQVPNRHAVQWDTTNLSNPPNDLGSLSDGHESHAYAFTGSGATLQVVGDSTINPSNHPCANFPPHAFLRDASANFTNLETGLSSAHQSRAWAVNVVGSVTTVVGQ
jgi:probable HAF family extracellular repeat protein